ncbi:hut operon transcriptional regulator HutP [Fictibacillus sp. B-59209]|uniref:hut operon transcriptional regulator HutP n=1 Tax=Fictibacillus sp. B-59209 TaxID=3024873 RepID=UPI002E1BFE4A|nr:hut operon transcriptional regulator HutP [Fictibacillus sp. B-59209]
MSLAEQKLIGKLAMLYVLDESHQSKVGELGWLHCTGKVGSMESNKVVAAIETAAKKNQIINGGVYRETHALYHAIMEALHGVTRGQVQLGTVLRTVGLRFAIVRGQPYEQPEEGEWIAVALYGTIGAPVKGLEHEAIGLGINHI